MGAAFWKTDLNVSGNNLTLRRRTRACWYAACMLMLASPTVRANDESASAPAAFTGERDRIIEHVQRDDLGEQEVRGWIEFAEEIKKYAKADLTVWERIERALKNPWVFFGFFAQGVFMMRFVVQLIASERKKRSYVPIAFWYLSLTGGLMLFVYAAVRRDPVFVLGQGLGIFIYARNLMLIRKRNTEMLERLDDRNRPPVDDAATNQTQPADGLSGKAAETP
jgi:lipid-A-disaccharide synthase-like uncharacterized protein